MHDKRLDYNQNKKDKCVYIQMVVERWRNSFPSANVGAENEGAASVKQTQSLARDEMDSSSFIRYSIR